MMANIIMDMTNILNNKKTGCEKISHPVLSYIFFKISIYLSSNFKN